MATAPASTLSSVEWQPGTTARVGDVVRLTASLTNIAATTPLTFTIREYSGGQYQERIVETLTTTVGPGSTTASISWPVRLVAEPGQSAGLPEYRFRAQLGPDGPARTSALLKPGRLARVDWVPLDGARAEPTTSSCQVAFAPGQRVGLVATGTKLQGFKANFAILQRQESPEGAISYTQVDQITGIPFTSVGATDTVTAMTEWCFDATNQAELVGGKFRFKVTLTHPSVPDQEFTPTQRTSRSKLACNQLPVPQLFEVLPGEGGLEEEVVVTLKGFNFRSGARVKFGTVKESEEVVFVDDRTLTAKAPIRATAKKVDVYVINPDGQTAMLAEAFTYLSEGTKGQARVLNVEPLTVLEGVATEIIVSGRHLKEAVETGFFGLRAPQRASIERISEPVATHHEASQIDTVIFTVRINPQPGTNSLNEHERMPVNILASRRANAVEDLLVESSQKVFTVVAGDKPVPMAYTKTLNRGQSNVVVVAGRNLAGCRLEFVSAEGQVSLDEQQGDERAIFGVASLGMDTASGLNLVLLGPDNTELSRYDLSLRTLDESGNQGSFNGANGIAALVSTNGVTTVPIDLQPVPEQKLLTAPVGGTKVFDLAAGTYLNVSVPDFNSPHLNSSVTTTVASLELALYNVELIFPFFDRGSDSLIDAPINARVGRLFGVRASAILLILRLSVNVDVEVGIIITINDPFDDIEFSDGAVLEVQVEFVVELEIRIVLRFVLAVLRPRLDSATAIIGTEMVVLAFLDLDFALGDDGISLNLAAGLGFRAQLLGPVAPFLSPGQIESGLIQIASADPCVDNYGFRSYFFAADNRQFCLNWRFPVLLERVADFTGTGEPRETILQETFEAQVCINVNANNDLRLIYFESPQIAGDPPELFLNPEVTDTATVMVKAQPVNGRGEPTGMPQTLIPGKDVDLILVPETAKIVDLITVANTAPVVINAISEGVVEIRTKVSTTGAGMGVLPRSVLGFASNPASPCTPMLLATALPTIVGAVPELALQITSPPVLAGQKYAVVALSNKAFIDPQPYERIQKPMDVNAKPDLRDEIPFDQRKLRLTGTVTGGRGDETVMVNSVIVKAQNFAWTAEIPLTGLTNGPLKVTATSGASTAMLDVYIARLDIKAPEKAKASNQPAVRKVLAEDDPQNKSLPSPRMAVLDARVQVVGLPGNDVTATTSFNWTLNIGGNYATRAKGGTGWPWYGEGETGATVYTIESGSIKGGSWVGPSASDYQGVIQDGSVLGGWAQLRVKADISLGNVSIAVVSDPRWFDIQGENPMKAIVLRHVDEYTQQKAYTYQGPKSFPLTMKMIVAQETNEKYQQFSPTPIKAMPQDTRTPLTTPLPFRPLFGAPAGIGLGQRDPARFPGLHWNWKLNLDDCIELFAGFWQQWVINDTDDRMFPRERDRLIIEASEVKKLFVPEAKDMVVEIITPPRLTVDQRFKQAIRQYNGGIKWRFDAYYRLTTDSRGYEIVNYAGDTVYKRVTADGKDNYVHPTQKWGWVDDSAYYVSGTKSGYKEKDTDWRKRFTQSPVGQAIRIWKRNDKTREKGTFVNREYVEEVLARESRVSA